ncbi:hypothetical protein X744_29320 [Mesorhizobium sp. LNJC372A00]|nr:hypothetical protein X744_29320 [Mesorhizobium sp. LNJC372A00]
MPTVNSIVSALRFFITQNARPPGSGAPARPAVAFAQPARGAQSRRARPAAQRAALSVAYGAGLRVAEVSMLKVADVDSERMLLRVERGKGGRYRNAMLSQDLLTLLREWWKV